MSSTKAIFKLFPSLSYKLQNTQNMYAVGRCPAIFLLVWTSGIINHFEFSRGRHTKAPDVSRHSARCIRWVIRHNILIAFWSCSIVLTSSPGQYSATQNLYCCTYSIHFHLKLLVCLDKFNKLYKQKKPEH